MRSVSRGVTNDVLGDPVAPLDGMSFGRRPARRVRPDTAAGLSAVVGAWSLDDSVNGPGCPTTQG
jgi:hypothetical protein